MIAREVVCCVAHPLRNSLAVGVVVLCNDAGAQVLFVVVADINGRLAALYLLNALAVPIIGTTGCRYISNGADRVSWRRYASVHTPAGHCQ